MKRSSLDGAVDGSLPRGGDTAGSLHAQDAAFGIPNEPSAKEQAEASRNRALLTTPVPDIQALPTTSVVGLQAILQHGSQLGYWETPGNWIPSRQPGFHRIDLRKRIVDFLPQEQQRWVEESELHAAQLRESVESQRVAALPGAVSQVHRIVEGAVLVCTRYLVVCRMGPVGLGSRAKNMSLDPSSLTALAYVVMPALLALGVSKLLDVSRHAGAHPPSSLDASSADPAYLGMLELADLARLSNNTKDAVHLEVRRMQSLAERGMWADVPMFEDVEGVVTSVAGPEKPAAAERVKRPHLPLPDDYVAEMGRRSLWLTEELGPNLPTVAAEIQAIWKRTDDENVSVNVVSKARSAQLERYLAGYVWRDSGGAVLAKLPFAVRLSEQGKNSHKSRKAAKALATLATEQVAGVSLPSEADDAIDLLDEPSQEVTWPPRTFFEVVGLMNTVQMAHMFIVTMAMAARKSETLDLKRSCVRYASDGLPYAEGRTYKLVERHDGEVRDWVLPDVAVRAVEQQVRLVRTAETIGPREPKRLTGGAPKSASVPGEHLWAQLGTSGSSNRAEPLQQINHALVKYARTLGLETAPGGQNIRSHRFRKTVARLVALALTQAPKVLMDVFGHKSIEMTLYYILTDKELRAEIEQVSRELRVMRAKDVVEEMVAAEHANSGALPLGGYGGPAALAVGQAIQVHKKRTHKMGEEWGAESALELASILTLDGKAWQLVRPGVICTKFPGTESGPCNRSKGHPEPSRCQTDCRHRLEETFLREDVDGSIDAAVKAYVETGESRDFLVQSHWAGQIRAHVGRFDDLRSKWMENPIVRGVVDSAVLAPEGVAA